MHERIPRGRPNLAAGAQPRVLPADPAFRQVLGSEAGDLLQRARLLRGHHVGVAGCARVPALPLLLAKPVGEPFFPRLRPVELVQARHAVRHPRSADQARFAGVQGLESQGTPCGQAARDARDHAGLPRHELHAQRDGDNEAHPPGRVPAGLRDGEERGGVRGPLEQGPRPLPLFHLLPPLPLARGPRQVGGGVSEVQRLD
mmetsp:Transcript_119423/g.372031  ORF Transcript_119423/g.372031 Transcript_119423/m.372031 type:complete len:201 (+) Transcript_119423:621-1223(+)